MSKGIDAFRSEIREVVSGLAQLNRTKIFLVTGLFAVAFGVAGFGNNAKSIQEYSYIILILIPFVCAYVDFQYYHGLAKIFVLAHFLTSYDMDDEELVVVQDYENFIEGIRKNYAPRLFGFEGKAQVGSSIMLSAFGPLLGIPLALSATNSPVTLGVEWKYYGVTVLLSSAIAGAIFVYSQFVIYSDELDKAKNAIPKRKCKKNITNNIHTYDEIISHNYVYKTNPVLRLVFKGSDINSFDDKLCMNSALNGLKEPTDSSNMINEEFNNRISYYKSKDNIDRYVLSISITKVLSIYGLGSNIRGFDRNIKTTTLLNNDTHFGSVDNSYSSFPVIFLHCKGHCIGILWNSSRPARIATQLYAESANIKLTVLKGGNLDNEFFITQGSFGHVVDFFTFLTGRPMRPPLWALGYHQSRWSYKNEKKVMKIAHSFKKHDIPCDSIYFDIHHMDSYKVFTWNKSRFRSPRKLFDNLEKLGIRGVVIVDPGVKVDKQYDVYINGIENKYFCLNESGSEFEGKVWPGKCVFPDFTRQEVRKWWGELNKRLIKQGVSGIWNDMNEPVLFIANHENPLKYDIRHYLGPHWVFRNKYALFEAESTFNAIKEELSELPFVLSRSGCCGVQQFAFVWTGDNNTSWDDLRQNLYDVLNLGMSGVPFSGADVGGFCNELNLPGILKTFKFNKKPELFLRWIQLGSLMPFFRVHTSLYSHSQEPWSFGSHVLDISRKHIKRRYHLLPYIYTLAIESHNTGLPIVRPLFSEYDYLEEITDQFLIGSDILAAPVLFPGVNSIVVTLPKGAWFEYETGNIYRIDNDFEQIEFTVTDDYYPLFVKCGTFIPISIPSNNSKNSFSDRVIFETYIIDGINEASGKAYYRTSNKLEDKDTFISITAIVDTYDYLDVSVTSINNNKLDTIVIRVPPIFTSCEINNEIITGKEVINVQNRKLSWREFEFNSNEFSTRFSKKK